MRLLFALSAHKRQIVYHLDVKTTFLNGDVREEVFVEQPRGCILQGNEHLVCKLKKALYGL